MPNCWTDVTVAAAGGEGGAGRVAEVVVVRAGVGIRREGRRTAAGRGPGRAWRDGSDWNKMFWLLSAGGASVALHNSGADRRMEKDIDVTSSSRRIWTISSMLWAGQRFTLGGRLVVRLGGGRGRYRGQGAGVDDAQSPFGDGVYDDGTEGCP